jgi:catecholate siderophore receptor
MKNKKKTRRNTERLMVMGALMASAAFDARLAGATPVAAGTKYEEAIADVLRSMRGLNHGDSQSQAPQASMTQRFDIPPGPLDAVLAAFHAQTGITVTAADAGIYQVQSPGVSGQFSSEQALAELLKGTGVAFRFVSATSVTLDVRAASEVVDVTGRAPRTTVSSPKFTVPLRDIPQTITVIPSDVMHAQGATTLRDVLRNVTGISIQAGEGGVPAGDNLSIRGFSARTDFFIDGVRDAGGYTRDPFNVEQVEVVKGPSSSYAGRGSTGGVVNLSTKAPHLAAARHVSIGGGSAGYRRGTVDVNHPMSGSTAVRLNAMWTDAETSGRDAVSSGRWGVAPSLAVGIGTPTRLTVSYAHLDQDNLPDYGIPWVPPTNVPLGQYADQPPPVDFRNFYGLTGRDYEDTLTDTATAVVEHDVRGAVTLRSLVRYGRTQRDSLITAPRFESNTSTAIRRTDWKSRDQSDGILASQTDVTSRFATAALRHSVVTGLELSRETSENWNRVELNPTAPSTDVFRPNPGDPYVSRLVRDGAVTDATARSAAAYVFDTVEVNPRLQLSGGLRFDRFALDYLTRTAAGADTPLDRVDTMVSWRSGVVFKPLPAGSVYAGAGTSLNPSTEGLSLTTSTVTLEPETSRSFEAGTKWDAFGGRLGVNAAAFHTTKLNARTPGLNPGDPPTVLDGEHVVRGVEMGATGNITPRWQLFGSYTFMDSEITRSNTLAEVGRAFANTPDHSLSLWTTYRLTRALELGGGTQYVGDRFNNNTGARVAPAYWLADAMAAYRVTDRFTLRVNGLNLADERYIDRVGGGHFIPGPGRAAMVTADVGF